MLKRLLFALFATAPALAEIPDRTLKIGVLNDQSGPFADQAGRGSVIAAQLAADDFTAAYPSIKVEILYGDHQNKPDIGSTIVRQWVDRDGVDAVADAVNSGVGLAVNQVLAERNRTFIATNVGTSDLTGKFCKPTTVQWTMDTWALGNAAASALTKAGAHSFYFISFDYALGAALERDTAEALDDALFGPVTVRIDGRATHPMYVFRVKSPAESRSEWDLYTLLFTVPADQAFRPLADGGCPLVK